MPVPQSEPPRPAQPSQERHSEPPEPRKLSAFTFRIHTFQSLPTNEQAGFLIAYLTNVTTALEFKLALLQAEPSSPEPSIPSAIAELVHERLNPGTVEKSLEEIFAYYQNNREAQCHLTKSVRGLIAKAYVLSVPQNRDISCYSAAEFLVGVLTAKAKGDPYLPVKHAAAVALETLFTHFGSGLVALSHLAVATLLKLQKASTHCGFSAACLETLAAAARAAYSAWDDAVLKSVHKLAKKVASGPSAACEAVAYRVLQALLPSRVHLKTKADFEAFRAIVARGLASEYPTVRSSAASLYASCLYLLEQTALRITQEAQAYAEAVRNAANAEADAEPEEERGSPSKSKQKVPRASSERKDGRPAVLLPAITKNLYGLAFADVLDIYVSEYLKATDGDYRSGLTESLAGFLLKYDASKVLEHYPDICHYLFDRLLVGYSSGAHSEGTKAVGPQLLIARQHVAFVINDVVQTRIFAQFAQVRALKHLTTTYLLAYDQQVDNPSRPRKEALIAAVSAARGLLSQLGFAPPDLEPELRTGFVKLLAHPAHALRIGTVRCLRVFVNVNPNAIVPLTETCLERVAETVKKSKKPTLEAVTATEGYAYALAALCSLTMAHRAYASLDVTTRALSVVSSVLRPAYAPASSGTLEATVAQQAATFGACRLAWIVLAGLMSLGQNFVAVHLSQLLLFWKGALARPLSRDAELLRHKVWVDAAIHMKYAALTAVAEFLQCDDRLVSTDVAKRLIVLLHNTEAFLGAAGREAPTVAPGMWSLTQKRVYQCLWRMTQLAPQDGVQPSVLISAVATFANLSAAPSRLLSELSPATELLGPSGNPLAPHGDAATPSGWEFEDTCIFHDNSAPSAPPSVAVTDLAIRLFGALFFRQTEKVQESLLEQLTAFLSEGAATESEEGSVRPEEHAVLALYCALTTGVASPAPRSSRIVARILDLLKRLLQSKDASLFSLAAKAIGLCCHPALGTPTETEQAAAALIKYCVDSIVATVDPELRATCALTLASAYGAISSVPSLRSAHLRSVTSILLQLSEDPHPTVHLWSIYGLSYVASATTGLAFAPLVPSCLRLTHSILFDSDNFCAECESTASSNLDIRHPTSRALTRLFRGLLEVLGPEAAVDATVAQRVWEVAAALSLGRWDVVTQAEAFEAIKELAVFCPTLVALPVLVNQLVKLMVSESGCLNDTGVSGLHQLMKCFPVSTVLAAHRGLGPKVWAALEKQPRNAELEGFVDCWLLGTYQSEPLRWFARLASLYVLPRAELLRIGGMDSSGGAGNSNGSAVSGGAVKRPDEEFEDEEALSFAKAAPASGNGSGTSGADTPAEDGAEPLRYTTKHLVVQTVRRLLRHCGSALLKPFAPRVGDLIRLSFAAATTPYDPLQLEGVRLLGDVIRGFADMPDPEFPQVSLLEQFQAQISSALTPVLAAESSPVLAAEAVSICGLFVGANIVQTVDRMGRLLRILTAALQSVADAAAGKGSVSVGELVPASANAQTMLLLAVLSAWARLQLSAAEHSYLRDVVSPHQDTLVAQWVAALRKYAELRLEAQQTLAAGSAPTVTSLDTVYSALLNQGELSFYDDKWLEYVEALGVIVATDNDGVTRALSEQGFGAPDDTASFFFVLGGLCVEALLKESAPGGDAAQTVRVLRALGGVLRPSLCGAVLYEPAVFSELVDVLTRLALSIAARGTAACALVRLVRDLCLQHPGNVREEATVEQMFELVRVVFLCLGTDEGGMSSEVTDTEVTKSKIDPEVESECLAALAAMAGRFPYAQRADLYAVILHVILNRKFDDGALPILPGLQVCLTGLTELSAEPVETGSADPVTLANVFFRRARTMLSEEPRAQFIVLAVVVAICGKILQLSEDDADELAASFVAGVTDSSADVARVAARAMRVVLVVRDDSGAAVAVQKALVRRLVQWLTAEVAVAKDTSRVALITKTFVELLLEFVKTREGSAAQLGMAVVVPLILWLSESCSDAARKLDATVARDTLLALAGVPGAAEAFKTVVGRQLTAVQRQQFERVVTGGMGAVGSAANSGQAHIELKTFA